MPDLQGLRESGYGVKSDAPLLIIVYKAQKEQTVTTTQSLDRTIQGTKDQQALIRLHIHQPYLHANIKGISGVVA
jgi:hypothetical protein